MPPRNKSFSLLASMFILRKHCDWLNLDHVLIPNEYPRRAIQSWLAGHTPITVTWRAGQCEWQPKQNHMEFSRGRWALWPGEKGKGCGADKNVTRSHRQWRDRTRSLIHASLHFAPHSLVARWSNRTSLSTGMILTSFLLILGRELLIVENFLLPNLSF